jgi:hypothetical protein
MKYFGNRPPRTLYSNSWPPRIHQSNTNLQTINSPIFLKMGNTKSKSLRLSSLSRRQRRKFADDSLSIRSLPTPLMAATQPTNPCKVFMDNSRSHSLASDISSGLRSDSETEIQQLEIIGDTVRHPKSLTPDQLSMVRITWQTVLNDSSNICLNFFHQLHRRFPQIQRMQQNQGMAHSTPSLPCTVQFRKRNLSCSLDPQKQPIASTFAQAGMLH